MRARNSIIVPIVCILSGVLLQLKSMGIFGDFLPADILLKCWPLLAIAAGLDLLFSQKRLIGALIMLFFAAAVGSTQFLAAGWNNPVWQLFLKIWPILLILFGVDSIFAGRSLINAAVIIMAVILAVYVLLVTLGVPSLPDLPFDLRSIIPSETFSWERPAPNQNQNQQTGPVQQTQQQDLTKIVDERGGPVAAALLQNPAARLSLFPASGKISLKAGAPRNQFLSGSVSLDRSEKITANVTQNGQSAVYLLKSSGNASSATESLWDLTLSALRPTDLNAELESGYFKADLRGLNLSSVSVRNKFGPIDIMVPEATPARISITADRGDVRIYIPKGGSVSCEITGAASLDYPQWSYVMNGTSLMPRGQAKQPVQVEIKSNNGTVRIIEIE